MSKSIKAIIALGFVAIVAACGGSAEEDVVIIEPIEPEPVLNKF
ncbi:MAG: hypothetical protein ABJ327_12330 [Litoreibacter sp.]